MDSNTIIEVLDKLIGDTTPVGDTIKDRVREQNLEVLIKITDWCIDGIYQAADYKNSKYASEKRIGEKAFSYLLAVKTWCKDEMES